MKKTKLTLSVALNVLFVAVAFAQAPGTFNANFGTNGYLGLDVNGKDQAGFAAAVQPDGKILVGGVHEHSNNNYDWLIYRLNENGTPDNTFSGDGQYSTSFSTQDVPQSIAVQPDGKIVICGNALVGAGDEDMIVHRLNANGTIDNSFGTGGTVQLDRSGGAVDRAIRVKIGPNGKIYVGGYMGILGDVYFIVHRLNPNGTPDSTFSLDGNTFVNMNADALMTDMDVAADGSVILSGAVDDNGLTKMVLIKIKNNGHFDDNFAGDGIKLFTPGLNVGAILYGVRMLPNGKILGVGTKLTNGIDGLVVRLNPNGLLDPTFNNLGYQTYDLSIGAKDAFTGVELLATGNFLLLGYTSVNNIDKGILVQLDSTGAIDMNNYGNGTGKLLISMSNGSEDVRGFAIDNTHAYTVGTYNAAQSNDIFVTSSYLYNPISIVENELNSNTVKIFPNPASAMQPITVHLDEEIQGNVQIDVYSMAGQQVYHDAFYKASNNYQHVLTLSASTRGVYLVRITNGERTGTQKLIIQ